MKCKCGCGKECKPGNEFYHGSHSLRLKGKEFWEKRKQKTIETNRRKYGCDYTFQSDQVKDSIKKTCLQRYGVEYSGSSPERRKKFEITMLERYGTTVACKNEELKKRCMDKVIHNNGAMGYASQNIMDKCKDTLIEKYGEDNPQKVTEIMLKTKETRIQRYGHSSPFSSSSLLHDKYLETMFNKFGTEWSMQSPECRQKAKETLFHNYGVYVTSQSPEIMIKMQRKYRLKEYQEILESVYCEPEFDINYFLKHGFNDPLTYTCKKCGKQFVFSKPNARHYDCFPLTEFVSKYEYEIRCFLDTLNVEYIPSCRSILPKSRELDIYIPTHNLAIEFDGIFWHNYNHLHLKTYHLRKTEECKQKGIKLIHIFENEWFYHKDICKWLIKDNLGLNTNLEYDENDIIKITDEQFKTFCCNYIINGYNPSHYRYGLMKNDEIVAVIAFNKIDNYFELTRFGSLYHIDYKKMLDRFIKDTNAFKIRYSCDRRWDNSYQLYNCDFAFVKNTRPNYWYIIDENKMILSSNFQYRKAELKIKFPNDYSDNLTEQENMFKFGYNCIYDCGSMLFEWTNPNYIENQE